MNEATYWPAVCQSWHTRAADMKLKPGTKRHDEQMCAFLQGALAVATATNAMTMERAHMLGFLVACGRAEMVLRLRDGDEQ